MLRRKKPMNCRYARLPAYNTSVQASKDAWTLTRDTLDIVRKGRI